MTADYNSLLKSPQWFEKRKTILARDNNTCRCCGVTSRLHVHHRQYHVIKVLGQKQLPWKYQDKYLITLCEKCHSEGHIQFKVPSFLI